jgi:cystathionine gamma-synthase
MGIEFDTIDLTDLEALKKAMRDETRVVWVETPTNPLLKIIDIAAVVEVAHDAGAWCVVDNTFASPYLQQPISLGADAVIHSATKYLGGHSDVVGGVIVTTAAEMHERLAFLQNSLGAVPGPQDCFLVLRGLKTLALRMEAHSRNAARVAEFLDGHERVKRVYYPGLPSHPGRDIAARQMRGFGGMVSFETHDEESALDVCRRTQLFFLAESLGGVESLIEHPGRMTHASVAGSPLEVPPNLVRLSVGIEHPDDLLEDLAQALA